MAYQVLQSGTMLEIVNGLSRDGTEKTTMVIARENDIVEKELSADLTRRYDEGDEYVRSILQRGTVVTDDDGNKALVPEDTVEVDSDEVATDAVERAEAAEGELTAAKSKISTLESELSTAQQNLAAAQSDLETARREATEQIEALTTEKDAAEEVAAGALSYSDLSKEALEAEAAQKTVTVTRADGKDGEPLKSDYVTALEAARSSS